MSPREAIVIGIQDETGWAVANRLRDKGCKVAALADPLDGAREGPQGFDLPCDTTDAQSVERAMSEACQRLPRLDALICLADHKLSCPLAHTSLEAFDRMLEGNLTYAMRAARSAMKTMRLHRGGSIVFVASSDYLHPSGDQAAYASSFGGLEAVTRSAAMDARAFGTRVNCLTVADRERHLGGFVGALHFLAGEESSYITGSTLSLDDVDPLRR